MFRCYVVVVDPGPMVTCAAHLVHSSQCERLDRHWRNLLMKHDLPVTNHGGWLGIARSKSLSEEDKGATLREFAIAAGDAMGFVVAIHEATWARVFRSRRRLFGSAEAFCYLRLLRVVLDRLESVQEASPIAVLFRRDVGSMDRAAKSAAKLFEMDTRACERVESMAFVDSRRDCHFAMTDLLIHLALPRLTGVPAGTAKHPPAALRTASLLPPLPDQVVIELWDEDFARRHIESLDWSMSSGVTGDGGRSRQKPVEAGLAHD